MSTISYLCVFVISLIRVVCVVISLLELYYDIIMNFSHKTHILSSTAYIQFVYTVSQWDVYVAVMAHYNMAFAADEYDRMDTSLHDYPEPTTTQSSISSSKSPPKPSGCFTFVDFCPEYRRKPDAWFFQADYETFRFVLSLRQCDYKFLFNANFHYLSVFIVHFESVKSF